VNAQLNTSPGAANSVDNTAPQPSDPQPTDAHGDNPAATPPAFTSSIQRTGMTINNISRRTSSFAGTTAALSGNKRGAVASGGQNADKSSPASEGNETAAGHDTTAKPQIPHTADVKASDEKSSGESASVKKKSNTTLSPQLIAPPTTGSAPKAKVIRWP